MFRACRSRSRSHSKCPQGLPAIRKLGARSSLVVSRIGVLVSAAISELLRTSLAIIFVLCTPNRLSRLQSTNYSRTFGYTFGYIHQFGQTTANSAKLQVRLGLAGSLITLDYAYLS